MFGQKSGILSHQVQNLLGAKAHTNCKISKSCQHSGGTKTHMGKIFGIWIFLSIKARLYRYYQKKNQLGVTASSYVNLTRKLLIKSNLFAQKQGKSEILIFWGSSISIAASDILSIFSGFILFQRMV